MNEVTNYIVIQSFMVSELGLKGEGFYFKNGRQQHETDN